MHSPDDQDPAADLKRLAAQFKAAFEQMKPGIIQIGKDLRKIIENFAETVAKASTEESAEDSERFIKHCGRTQAQHPSPWRKGHMWGDDSIDGGMNYCYAGDPPIPKDKLLCRGCGNPKSEGSHGQGVCV